MNTVIEPCCYSKQLTQFGRKPRRAGAYPILLLLRLEHRRTWCHGHSSTAGCEGRALPGADWTLAPSTCLSELLRRTYHDRTEGEEVCGEASHHHHPNALARSPRSSVTNSVRSWGPIHRRRPCHRVRGQHRLPLHRCIERPPRHSRVPSTSSTWSRAVRCTP